MLRRLIASFRLIMCFSAVLPLAPVPSAAQTAGPGQRVQLTTWTTPSTPWGEPDLQGTWTNFHQATSEIEAPRRRSEPRRSGDGGVGAGPEHWYEARPQLDQKPIIVEPADGRLPALTPWATTRNAYIMARETDSHEYLDPK